MPCCPPPADFRAALESYTGPHRPKVPLRFPLLLSSRCAEQWSVQLRVSPLRCGCCCCASHIAQLSRLPHSHSTQSLRRLTRLVLTRARRLRVACRGAIARSAHKRHTSVARARHVASVALHLTTGTERCTLLYRQPRRGAPFIGSVIGFYSE